MRENRDYLQRPVTINWRMNFIEMQIEAIKREMERLNISQPMLAKMVGMSFDMLNKTLANRRILKADEAKKIQDALEHLGADPFALQSNDNFETPDNNKKRIPIYGFALGNSSNLVHLTQDNSTGFTNPHPGQLSAERGFAVEIVGDCMSPRYEAGELAFAVWGQTPMKGQDVIIELLNGDAHIKRFISLSGSELLTEQLNPPKKVPFRLAEVKRLHAVVGSGRR